MELQNAIRTRRTHKVFGPEAVDPETIADLIELARWAPNHHLTNPWRFRVLGARALARLKAAAGPDSAAKLDRAPTLIAVTARRAEDPVQDEEDVLATAASAYALLLAAHDRGLAGYWRTPEVLRRPEGLDALGIPDDERFVALIHLGPLRQDKEPPERAPVSEILEYLD